jgi:hypothetical protein
MYILGVLIQYAMLLPPLWTTYLHAIQRMVGCLHLCVLESLLLEEAPRTSSIPCGGPGWAFESRRDDVRVYAKDLLDDLAH